MPTCRTAVPTPTTHLINTSRATAITSILPCSNRRHARAAPQRSTAVVMLLRADLGRLLLLLLALWPCCWAAAAESKPAAGQPQLHERFQDGWKARWKHSKDPKYKGRFQVAIVNGTTDKALLVPKANRHYAITRVLRQPLQPLQGLVVQYEAQFSEGHGCGGAYIKLLPAEPEPQPEQLSSSSPYTIMFGPDRCGPQSRVHLIINSRNPVTGKMHERHLEDPPGPPGDKLTHLYTLQLTTDNKYRILIDGKEAGAGDLLDPEEFFPPFQPPEEIPDPDDKKPDDWVDIDTIDDPTAIKPSDWDERRKIPNPDANPPEGWLPDEPELIPDPSAQPPAGWVASSQGEWQAPLVPNPKCSVGCGPWTAPLMRNPNYKGTWFPPRVPNPEYKGEWKARNISNPGYYKEDKPLTRLDAIGAIAFEIWTTDKGYRFSNIILANDDKAAAAFRSGPFKKKHDQQVQMALKEWQGNKYHHLPVLARLLFEFVDQPWMAALKPRLAPVMKVLWDKPNYAYFSLLLPALLLLLGGCLVSSRRHVPDVPDPEEQAALAALMDEEVLEQQKAMGRVAAAAVRAQQSTSAGQQGHSSSKEATESDASERQQQHASEQQQEQEGKAVAAEQEVSRQGDQEDDELDSNKQASNLRRRRQKA